MQEPTETIIVRAQIEIEDDKILKTLKKYKNVIYRIISLGLLFPASVKMTQNKQNHRMI